MKRNLTGYQFRIYWTRLNVNKALSSCNGNVCITLSIQNIDYKKKGKSNGQCHFCTNEIESLMHLFYRCHKIKHVFDELKQHFWKEYSTCWGKLNHWSVWGRNNWRSTFSEFGNLYIIKTSNLENKKLYKI